MPFLENQQHSQQPRKFISPANAAEDVHQKKRVLQNGWTSNQQRRNIIPTKDQIISPTFTRVRGNGLMFGELLMTRHPPQTASSLEASQSVKNGSSSTTVASRVKTQENAYYNNTANKISYEKFSSTLKFKNGLSQSMVEQSKQGGSQSTPGQQQNGVNYQRTFILAGDQLPILNTANNASFKAKNPSSQRGYVQQKRNIFQPAQANETATKDPADNTAEDQNIFQTQQQLEMDLMTLTFSPSQDIKTVQQHGRDSNIQNSSEKKALHVAKSLPSLSNRGTTQQAVSNIKNIVPSLPARQLIMIQQANLGQTRERQANKKESRGLNDTPLFIQSLDKQSTEQTQKLGKMTAKELENFLNLITSIGPMKQMSNSVDNAYMAAVAAAYQKRQANSTVPTQRFQHVQNGQQIKGQAFQGLKITPKHHSKFVKDLAINGVKSSQDKSATGTTNYSSSAVVTDGNSSKTDNPPSSYQSLSGVIVKGEKPPISITNDASPSKLKDKKLKYAQNQSKFVVGPDGPVQVLSTSNLIPIVTLVNDDYQTKSNQISKRKGQDSSPLQIKGKGNHKANKKSAAGGFRLNVNPSQSLLQIASQVGSGTALGKDRNSNFIELAMSQGQMSQEDKRYKISSAMRLEHRNLYDKPTSQSRPQTVQGSTTSSVDLTKEQLFQLKHQQNGDDLNLMQNRELLSSIIKDILHQRKSLNKQHLENINRPSSNVDPVHHHFHDITKAAITVSELARFQTDLKDIPVIQSTQDDNSVLIQDDNNPQTESFKIETFTKDEYIKIVNQWKNIKIGESSLSEVQNVDQKKLESFTQLASQLIFPLESLNNGSSNIFRQIDEEIDSPQQIPNNERITRAGKDIIKKKLLNGRPYKGAKNVRTNSNKRTQDPQAMPVMVIQTGGELLDPEPSIKNPKVYPPARIEIFHTFKDDQTPYIEHPVNRAIGAINSFIYATFRCKLSQSTTIILDHLIPVLRKFNLPLPPRGTPITGGYLRTKEFLGQCKYVLMTKLCNSINQSNDYDPKKYEQQSQAFKYFVGRGNNDHIVKVILKQRLYCNWTQKDKLSNQQQDPIVALEETTLDDVNFIWTQVKRQHIVNSFGPFKSQLDRPKTPLMSPLKPQPLRMYGKLENNYHLSNKKALFANMKLYYEAIGMDPFDVLPLTFHIKNGLDDLEFREFRNTYLEFSKNSSFKNVWIVKPGENTNRGHGIEVCCSLKEVEAILRNCNSSTLGYYSTFIVQKYIEKPLLIKRRKFDIRTYGLFTTINGIQKGYYYNDGYIRTSCKEYNTNNLTNKFIHLTNDAIQKKSDDYGKFENGNKLTFKDFQKYLDQNFGYMNIDFCRDMLPQIKKLVQDTFRAVYGKLDPEKRQSGFEIFGYDFMIDEDFKIYLIEVNTNPCLETSCPLLARIISEMLDNSFRVAFDPVYYHTLVGQVQIPQAGPLTQSLDQRVIAQSSTPGSSLVQKKQMTINCISDLTISVIKYELVFDEKVEGAFLREKVLSRTMIDPADNIYLQEDDEEADKQEEDSQPKRSNNILQVEDRVEGQCKKSTT